MKFHWEKKGHIFKPDNEHAFMKSHVQIPTALYLKDENKIRIYVAARPLGNIAQTSFIDVDAKDPSKILYIHDKPILNFGKEGMFDEHGIMPNFVMKKDNLVYLYYTGWSRRDSIPYSNWAGLATSDDNGFTFKKSSPAPVLDRTTDDLYSTGVSDIKIENGVWRSLYVSGIDWIKSDGKYDQTYSIKYATSPDGINWKRSKDFIIPQSDYSEAITRPTVVKIGNRYHMWFCFRGCEDYRDGANSYRIGYAWSEDYRTWHRDDSKSGITVSPKGWDSRMIAYPYIIQVEDRYLMFYNGNYFGKEGFGYAELKIN